MPKSARVKKGMRKTMKRSTKITIAKTASTKATIVKSFLEMLNFIKLYHWKTESYSQHQATDELHEKLSENVDKFVEVLLGKDASRVSMVEKHMKMMDVKNTADFIETMHDYRAMLLTIDRYFHKKRDSDLLNIRDEMLADVNQFLYLMSLDQPSGNLSSKSFGKK
jgi:DNA-binding ferritin-like protein